MINILNDYARFSTMFPSGHQPPPNLNVSSLIVDCHGNLTIYEVLQLNTIHDIEEVLVLNKINIYLKFSDNN